MRPAFLVFIDKPGRRDEDKHITAAQRSYRVSRSFANFLWSDTMKAVDSAGQDYRCDQHERGSKRCGAFVRCIEPPKQKERQHRYYGYSAGATIAR